MAVHDGVGGEQVMGAGEQGVHGTAPGGGTDKAAD